MLLTSRSFLDRRWCLLRERLHSIVALLTSFVFFDPQVVAGQTAALALKKVKRAGVRKGMVLADERLQPKASWEFDADIAILTHSTTIQPRYQVRRSARRSNL